MRPSRGLLAFRVLPAACTLDLGEEEWTPPSGPAREVDPRAPKTIQERAWTSPVWYTP